MPYSPGSGKIPARHSSALYLFAYAQLTDEASLFKPFGTHFHQLMRLYPSAIQAAFLASLLNDPLCLEFINSIAFLDAKRPITKKVLQRINLKALYQQIDGQSLLRSISKELEHLGVSEYVQNLQSIEVERLLTDYSSAGESNKCEQYTLDALLSEQVSLVE